MIGHTPGPWRVDSDHDPVEIVGRPKWGCTRFGVRGEWVVAQLEELDDASEAAANARLIAAAPELLEGADDALKAFKLLRVGLADKAPETLEMIDAHIDELSYVIAKATGTPSNG